MPPVAKSTAVASAADTFETALKTARIPDPLHDGMWDVWVDNPLRAYALVARFKDNGRTPAVTYKAADHPGDVALNAAIDVHGEDKIVALLEWAAQASPEQLDQQLAAGPTLKRPATVTDSGPMSVQKAHDAPRSALEAAIKGLPFEAPVTKDQPDDLVAKIMQGDLRSDMIPR